MKDYIPYELRSIANQIDPHLDLYWQENFQNLFSQINLEYREMISNQILQKKSIYWNKADNSFKITKQFNFPNFIESIPNLGIKNLAEKILVSCSHLEKYTDALEIASFVEGLLAQINKIDTEENLSLQKYKNEIKTYCIYHIAHIIKNKPIITTESNIRNLDSDVIKVFINEVYLKHQLLQFWFKTVQLRELKQQKNSLFHEFIVQQKQLRQLEIVKTSKYFFCLSQPANNKNINTFSIRRFLTEEKSLVSDIFYLNGVSLNLSKLNDKLYIDNFHSQMEKIVTIEKQIGDEVTNFIEKLQEHNNIALLPLLLRPLDSSGMSMEKVVEERLIEFEKDLILNILEPTALFLKSKINHQDEYDYIYISLREIFSDILNYYHDFQSQPAVLFDNKAKLFFYRLVSWLNLLEKRNKEIFRKQNFEEWNLQSEKMYESINELSLIIKTSLNNYRETYKAIKELEREISSSNSIISKIFNTKKKKEDLLLEQHQKLNKIKVDAFLDIIRVPKKYPHLTVYLEYESQISVNEKERHYAFSVGNNGISRLPIMIQLPEDKSKFNLNEIHNNLSFDINLANQKWV
ncbi:MULTISPECIES: hypothetical protein [Acinetobacter]|uniref:hypothetical protein n=1 Tax=Acinetobacter TaxID=469 RepID=UPI0015D44F88|nr:MULTISPECIES: hypothetical protein [Acinetobacter]UNT62984.1 hypothetical protein IHE36_06025 [Acinetobacter towneri]